MKGERGFRVVVGVDESAPSRPALEWAVTEQEDALKPVDSEGVTVAGDVIQGNSAKVLLQAAGDADLLAQVLHHPPCPVLVVRTRPRAGSDE